MGCMSADDGAVRLAWASPSARSAVYIRPGLLAAGARRAGRPQGEADMIPASFEYAVARDVADAIQLLASSGGEGKVLAGGQSLIPLMKFRLAQPALLIDINRVTGLGEIRENGELRTGALVRAAVLEANAIVRDRYQ